MPSAPGAPLWRPHTPRVGVYHRAAASLLERCVGQGCEGFHQGRVALLPDRDPVHEDAQPRRHVHPGPPRRARRGRGGARGLDARTRAQGEFRVDHVTGIEGALARLDEAAVPWSFSPRRPWPEMSPLRWRSCGTFPPAKPVWLNLRFLANPIPARRRKFLRGPAPALRPIKSVTCLRSTGRVDI